MYRLILCGLIAACALALVVLLGTARAAHFENDWLYEDLTCEELASGYGFEMVILTDLLLEHDGCLAYADSPADSGFGDLHCALLKKEGAFVAGVINDIVGVFNAKRCGDK